MPKDRFAGNTQRDRVRKETREERALTGPSVMLTVWSERNRDQAEQIRTLLAREWPEEYVGLREILARWLDYLGRNDKNNLTLRQMGTVGRARTLLKIWDDSGRLPMSPRPRAERQFRGVCKMPRSREANLSPFLRDPSLLPKKPPAPTLTES